MSDHSPDPAARPTPRIPRVSIGQMMAVVAACAAFSGSLLGALVIVLFVGGFVLPLVWFVTAIGSEFGSYRIVALALTAGTAIAWGVLSAGDNPFMFALTIVNGLGLFVVVDRRFHRKPLTSGHLIWAFAGLVWITGSFTQPPQGHGHRQWIIMEFEADLTRLLLAAVILLIAFARRPTDAEDRRTDRAGWLVVECDVIAYGLIAAVSLHWI